MKKLLVLLMLVMFCGSALAEEEIISLPQPVKTGGLPLMEAISLRRSSSNFQDTELTDKDLATLLWSAGGVNREDGKRVFPSALNTQDIIIFAFTKSGVYRYNHDNNSLTVIEHGDYRNYGAVQPFGAKAAVVLVYVQDVAKWPEKVPASLEQKKQAGFSHTGFSMQNVYLYAASQGWGARTVMSMNYEKLPEILGLTETQHLVLAQCVGPLTQE
ncbi:MAG: SagB/ThcOx family dehydrogenase [Synergistaceae bacterium]|nr:SagB/ThcOx family dehydrogenase [Synergistaceae bacterium]